MKHCNIVLTSKGGVGKSYVAWGVAQYGMSKGYNMYCADTDPANPTFASYPALQAQYFNIADDEMQMDRSRFDELIDNIAMHDGFSVIDTGASVFFSLMSYMTEYGTLDMLKDNGVRTVIHAVVAGGAALKETLVALEKIMQHTNVEVVIWENCYFGFVEINGKSIVETQLYKQYRDRILGIVNVKARAADTFGKDLTRLLGDKLTFAEVASPRFRLAQQQRLAEVRRELYDQLEAVGI